MNLPNRAYNIIYRLRRKSEGVLINTKCRTVEVCFDKQEMANYKPIMRLEKEFGFIIQFYL